MKCLRKSGCTCKVCKKQIKFDYKILVLCSKFSIDDCKEMYLKNKGFKYPKTSIEKEMTSRQSMWSSAYLKHLYCKDEIRNFKLNNLFS